MVLVRGGSFERLSDGTRAEVVDVCLDEFEVTVDAFAASVARGEVERSGCEGACPPVPKRTAWGDPSEDWNASKYCNGTRENRGNHPVNCVSLDEAIAHCHARGARLPTSTEWEWAARGSDRLATPWGGPVAKGEICWGKPKKRDGTCPVGSLSKDTSRDSVRDLGGNVSEWTEGRSGPPSRVRHAQGASWYAIDDGYARAALGGFDTPAQRAETIGFRCAADVAR
jgi:formylglycine-generating enzyme required for sulfatase activity